MTDTGKLFQVFIFAYDKNISLNRYIYDWLALNYAPLFYNADVFQSWR